MKRKLFLCSLFACFLFFSCSEDNNEPVGPTDGVNTPPDDEPNNPSGTLIELWGMTTGGGDNSLGTIFKTDNEGNNFNTVYSFNTTDGSYPVGTLLLADNGKFYGMTTKGGINNAGVIFEFNPSTNVFSKKFDFNINNGGNPQGNLIQASNGKIYGFSGKYIFEYNILNNQFNLLYTLNSGEGSDARGSLLEVSSGRLLGVTYGGGANFNGTLIQYDITSNTVTKKVDFGGDLGTYPTGDLLKATNGKVYGLTSYGGGTVNGNFYQGVLFEYNPLNDAYVVKARFINSAEIPQRGLIEGTNGKLYGVTSNGGSSSDGVIFEYSMTSPFVSVKYSFSPSDGERKGTLLEATNGKLYGFTYDGDQQPGGLYEFNPSSNSFTIKKIFEAGQPSIYFPSGEFYTGGLTGRYSN